MNLNMLNFTITTHEKFIIHVWDLDDIIHCCYQSQVLLSVSNKKIIIGKSIIADFAEKLIVMLKLALNKKLLLHQSIKKNIGYYWNDELNMDNPNLFLKKGKEGSFWVGYKYLLWTTDSNLKNEQYATWMYNDDQGNIIFQVTPVYPETFIDIENSDEVHAYQSWMEHYQPFYTRIISQETAEQWLKKAKLILKTIRTNVKKLKKEYKES